MSSATKPTIIRGGRVLNVLILINATAWMVTDARPVVRALGTSMLLAASSGLVKDLATSNDEVGGQLRRAADIAFIVASAILFVVGIFEAPHFIDRLTRLPRVAATSVGTSLSLVSAYGLFQLKVRRLKWYAHLEIGFAIASTWATVDRARAGFGLPEFSALGAALYLTVRGLDNRKKAMENESF
jgi:hypothetical protein